MRCLITGVAGFIGSNHRFCEQEQYGDVRECIADMNRAQQLIDYRPLTSLREGLAQEFDAIVPLYSKM